MQVIFQQTNMETLPVSEYKIRFHDCDLFGHLNNARYIDYMITARQDHLSDVYQFDTNAYYKNSQGWVISAHEIQYQRPAVYDEKVKIRSALLAIEEDSLLVEIVMYDLKCSHIKAVLRSKMVFINLKTCRREKHDPEFLAWARHLIVQENTIDKSLSDRVRELTAELKMRDT